MAKERNRAPMTDKVRAAILADRKAGGTLRGIAAKHRRCINTVAAIVREVEGGPARKVAAENKPEPVVIQRFRDFSDDADLLDMVSPVRGRDVSARNAMTMGARP